MSMSEGIVSVVPLVNAEIIAKNVLCVKVTLSNDDVLMVTCDGNTVSIDGELTIYGDEAECIFEEIEDSVMELVETVGFMRDGFDNE